MAIDVDKCWQNCYECSKLESHKYSELSEWMSEMKVFWYLKKIPQFASFEMSIKILFKLYHLLWKSNHRSWKLLSVPGTFAFSPSFKCQLIGEQGIYTVKIIICKAILQQLKTRMISKELIDHEWHNTCDGSLILVF